jgi:arylsulfatase A-like enzyme
MADDLGYGDLSCYGRQDYKTPNLDKLAFRGIKFINAYAAAPVCTPTRAAFMTGKYPARSHVGLFEPLKITPADSLVGLAPQQKSVATYLKESGYQTMLIGKWHLGFQPQFSPMANGFENFFGFYAGAIDYVSHNINGKPGLVENGETTHQEGYMTDLIAARAADYIKSHHSNPFFLSLQFNAPHWPWQGPSDNPLAGDKKMGPALKEGGSKQTFANMMKSLDDAVGTVMKAIDDAKLTDNTVIIFTSDNGGEKFSNMDPYRGYKMDLTEGGIRVPAFISWPGVIPTNTTTHQLAITMDWTATILAIAGVNSTSDLDGTNLLPVCTGSQEPFERTFYWRTFQVRSQHALRNGKWKYLKSKEGEFLFDLSADPGEQNNLKEKLPSTFQDLKNKYHDWEKTVLKPIPL